LVPAAGLSVEVPAGAAEALTSTTEVPLALKEEEAGILQFEVSSISPRAPLILRGGRLLIFFLVDRVMPTISALAPAKALKSGTPAMTRRHSKRAPWTIVSAAATGEPSRTAAVARPQLKEAVAMTSQALVPRAPPQGREQARSESRPTGDHGAAGAAADDNAPPRVGPIEGATRVSPRGRAKGAGDAGGQLHDVAAPDA
jgi:hypothetical protein